MARSGIHSYIGTLEALRCRCDVDRDTRCWNWLGATSSDGRPRVYGFDHARGEKRSMTGSLAVWNLAFGRAPLPGWLVLRGCGGALCLNPVHLREIRNRAEMGDYIRRAGFRKGTAVAARRANQRIASLASGKVPTAPEIVRAIRAAPASVTAVELARTHGIAHQTASRIRRGDSHREVV